MTGPSGTLPSAAATLPRYGEAALSDLLPSVAASLGIGGYTDVLGLTPARRACVLLVDGLGYELLRAHRDVAPYLNALSEESVPESDGSSVPASQDGVGRAADSGRGPGPALTAGFPATTVTSLASLGTGLPPGVHGILGCVTAVPGTGKLLNHLKWDQQVDPLTWQPHSTVFDDAVRHGVAVSQVAAAAYDGTGLTLAALRGAAYVPAEAADERMEAAARVAASTERALVYTYLGDLDHAGHTHGTASPQWRAELERADRLVERLAKLLPAGTALYVTGDHGMVDVPADARYDADTDPALADGIALLGGESRARHLYVRPGAADDVLAAWRERLGADAWVASREEATAAGWFGRTVPETRNRIGDVVAALRTDRAVIGSVTYPHEARQIGMHGSLTAAEQLVPLLRVLT